MKERLTEQSGNGTAAQKQKELPSPGKLTVEELSQAVGKTALLQVEVDGKIVSHIIAMHEELRSARNDIQFLRSQLDQLIDALALALEPTSSSQIQSSSTETAPVIIAGR
jgi:hypothetical protein